MANNNNSICLNNTPRPYLKANEVSYKDFITKNVPLNGNYFLDTRVPVVLRFFYTRPTWGSNFALMTSAERRKEQIKKYVLWRPAPSMHGYEEVFELEKSEVTSAFQKREFSDIILSFKGLQRFLKKETYQIFETLILELIERIQIDHTVLEGLLTVERDSFVGTILLHDYDLIAVNRDSFLNIPFPFHSPEVLPCFVLPANEGRATKRWVDRCLIPPVFEESSLKLLQDYEHLKTTYQNLKYSDCFVQICNENPYVLGTTGTSFFVCALPWL